MKDRTAALALLVMVIALAGLLLVRPLWAQYAGNRDLIADLEDKVARFESIARRQGVLEQQLLKLEEMMDLGELTLQANSATLAAANLQERVKATVQQAGGSLTSTQILEAEKIAFFERISVNVRMTGPTPAVQESLYSLENDRPLLVIDDLLIVTRRTAARAGTGRAAQQERLDVRFKVSGFYQPGPEDS